MKHSYIILILLTWIGNTALAQNRQIAGIVVSQETNEPLAKASVMIKGTTQGTVTGEDGKFRMAVPAGGNTILVLRSLGYENNEVPVGSQNNLVIRLTGNSQGLSEIVVIGYGAQKKRNVTGSIASYNAKDIAERPIARVDQALVGQMAGVQVKQTTGTPGKAFSVQVRGSGSISAGNEPLYVLDGFPLAQAQPNASGNFTSGNPLDNINPNDIESIQVLKDAAAAAIYGSRAANGVVLITTKQGKTGKPTISFNTNVGYSAASKKLDMLSADEWIDRATDIINAQWIASGTGRTADQTTAERRQILGLGAGLVDPELMLDDRWSQPGHPGLHYIDWQDEGFRKGLTQNYQLSASGGNEHSKYYVSGNYDNQNGILKGMDYTSYSARANVELNASKRLKFGLNLAPSYSLTNNPGPVEGKSGIFRMLVSFPPVQEDLPGNVNVGNYGQYLWSNPDKDPISKLENTIGLTKTFRTLASVFGEYQITDDLTFKTTANLDNIDNSVKVYIPYIISGTLITRQNTPGLIATGSYNSFNKQTFVNENTLSYNKVINDVHNISVLAGASYNYDKLSNVNLASTGGFVSSEISTLNAASGIKGGTMEGVNILLSYFGRVQYAYNSKYLLSASLRRDGSSRFGANTKWGWFPAASLGWRLSQENFLKNNKVINELKLRASWGESGNYSIGDYSSLPLLGVYNYTFGNAVSTGQEAAGIVNPDLSWEKSQTIDVGFDLEVLQSRISASFDYYNKRNSDLLLNVPIMSSTGFTSYLNNAGKVDNKGWEVELNTRNLTGEFKWTTSVNLSHNTNKVVELSGGQTQILIPSNFGSPNSILKVGESMYSIDVVKQLGILSKEDIMNGAALYGSETEGDPKYFDANRDGVIDDNDRVIVGHPSPDYTWGVSNTFHYKNLDLTVLVHGQTGGKIYSLLGRAINRPGLDANESALGIYRNRWRSAEDPGDGIVGKAYSTFGSVINTDWLYSSDYWRVQNITLGYDLGKVLKNKFIRGFRVYATVENFFGHDKYDGGFNPEATNEDVSGSTTFPQSGDYGGLPLPKSIILGLNLTF